MNIHLCSIDSHRLQIYVVGTIVGVADDAQYYSFKWAAGQQRKHPNSPHWREQRDGRRPRLSRS